MSRRDTGVTAPRRRLATPRGPVAIAVAAVLAVALPLFLATAVGAETGRLTAHLATGHPAAPALNTRAWTSDGTPAVGALFTTSRSGARARHFCSAAVVDSPAGDLLITAAHCLTGQGQVVFVPGYAGGRAPYGAWTVTRVVLAPQWTSSADPDDDVAFLMVSQPQTGVAIQRVTGGERLGTGPPPPGPVVVTGYPVGGDSPVSCRNYARLFSPTQLVFRCGGFTSGTSGGPLLADVDAGTRLGTLIGVIGGYRQGGQTDAVSYAARLSATVAALYQTALYQLAVSRG
jgi:V8-like Glu-specific endopeptidase